MTITIGWWTIPLLATVAIIAWWLVKMNEPSGDYDFGFMIDSMLGAILLMGVWLVYFVVLVWLS